MPKILEFKNQDWMKGISAQPNMAIGGLFQYIQGCDPFEPGFGGLAAPSLSPDNQTLGTTPKFITGFNNAGVSTLSVLTATKMYMVLKDSPYTVTDKTAQLDQHLPAGSPINHNGHIIYKGKYIYVTYGNGAYAYYVNGTSLVPSAANDTFLYNANTVSGFSQDYFTGSASPGNFTFRFCTGADGQLYMTMPEAVVCLNMTVAGNTITFNAGTIFKIDPGFIARDIINDGRYLVILADNNALNDADKVDGDFQSKVYFWDMVQTDGSGRIVADVIWDLKDSYLIGGRFLENAVYFFGHNGLYVCNIATSPKLIRPYSTTVSPATYGRPLNAYQITASKGSIYWVDGIDTIYGYVYAYGNPVTGQAKIFYIPYVESSVSGGFVHTCLATSGNQFITGSTQPGLDFFNVGSTRGRVVVKTLDTNMVAPYTFAAIKVTLGQPMAAGQTLQVIATSAGGTNTLSSETKSYTKPKQTFLFRRTPPIANQSEKFEDIAIVVSSNGAPIQRVALYATPIDDLNEDL